MCQYRPTFSIQTVLNCAISHKCYLSPLVKKLTTHPQRTYQNLACVLQKDHKHKQIKHFCSAHIPLLINLINSTTITWCYSCISDFRSSSLFTMEKFKLKQLILNFHDKSLNCALSLPKHKKMQFLNNIHYRQKLH